MPQGTHGGGFRSKAQWRWAFATKKPFAHRWAHATEGGPRKRFRRLPGHVRKQLIEAARAQAALDAMDSRARDR